MRYEIPCTVSGSVVVDRTRYRIDSVPGQRDHSWGARDWWSMNWLWSALHLDDGTHLHAVEDRDGTVTELHTITAREVFDANGLPEEATLVLDSGGVTATVDLRGPAPLRLVAGDGRISEFPRVWATVRTADGRSGVGWLEWNRNRPGQ